jgi:hypothetical protein
MCARELAEKTEWEGQWRIRRLREAQEEKKRVALKEQERGGEEAKRTIEEGSG